MLRQVLAYSLDDILHLPNEDTRIPEELARLYKYLRQLQVRLLGEALHTRNLRVVALLDISVACLGTTRCDADGHQGVVVGCKVDGILHDRVELSLVEDEVVGRGHNHHCIGCEVAQVVCCIADARCSVAAYRLAEYLVLLNLGNMLQDELLVASICHHDEILGRHKVCKSFVGHSQK